jgi:ATP/maltotriose-dependent transcriptional regulator MalT
MYSSNRAINKISPVSIGKVVERDRLFALLNKEPPTTSFWISGPGGVGKTTLIASFLQREKKTCLWYQVDGLDTDPATFFYYLGQAVTSLTVTAESPLPLLTPEYLPSLDAFILSYFEALFERIPPDTWLVIDNFQDAPNGSLLSKIVSIAIKQAPPRNGVVILSRNGPPPIMTRFLANRTMRHITGDALAFTYEEFSAFLALSGYRVSEEEAATLHSLTQGWISGVILFLLHRINEPKILAVPSNRAPENIFSYFAGEILEKATPEINAFLLKTAFLPHMTSHNASKLTGQDAGYMFEKLFKMNCFIEKRFLPAASYQYHPLFRAFLLNRAEELFDADTLVAIRCQSAAILEKNGMVEDAAELYQKARAHQHLETMILSQAQNLINQGRHAVLLSWIESLPKEQAENNPSLLFWKSAVLLATNPLESNQYCSRAFDLFLKKNDLPGQILSWSTAVNIQVMLRHNFHGLEKWITLGERLSGLLAENAPPDMVGRFASSMLMALLIFNQSHRDLPRWQSCCEAMLDRCDDPQVLIDLLKNLCWSYGWMGQLQKSLAMETRLSILLQNPHLPPLGRILLTSLQASSFIARGAHQQCHQMVNKSLSIARDTGIHIFDFMILTSSAYSWLGRGELENIPEYLHKMKATLTPYAVWDQAQYHCIVAWHSMQTGNLVEALQSSATAVDQAQFCGSPLPIALCRIVQSQVHLEMGDPQRAGACLDAIGNEPRLRKSDMIRFLVLLAKADCALANHQSEQAKVFCRDAFAAAREKGIWMPYGLHNRRMGAVCALALEAGIEESTVVEMIKCWRLIPPDTAGVREQWPWPVRIHCFGRLEIECEGSPLPLSIKTPKKPLELLTLLICAGRSGMSREQLADRLWPDAEGDLAMQNLATTLHRLRRLFSNRDIVRQKGNQLVVNRELCWVDSWHFQWLVQRIAMATEKSVVAHHVARALQLYEGAFFSDNDQLQTVVGYSSQLERAWMDVLAAAISLIANGQLDPLAKGIVMAALEDDRVAQVVAARTHDHVTNTTGHCR